MRYGASRSRYGNRIYVVWTNRDITTYSNRRTRFYDACNGDVYRIWQKDKFAKPYLYARVSVRGQPKRRGKASAKDSNLHFGVRGDGSVRFILPICKGFWRWRRNIQGDFHERFGVLQRRIRRFGCKLRGVF